VITTAAEPVIDVIIGDATYGLGPNRVHKTASLQAKALIDTGAAATFISPKLVDRLKLHVVKEKARTWTLGDKRQVNTSGVIQFTILRVAKVNVRTTLKAHVLDTPVAEIILGRDYLRMLGVELTIPKNHPDIHDDYHGSAHTDDNSQGTLYVIAYEEPDIEDCHIDNKITDVEDAAIRDLLKKYPRVAASELSDEPCSVDEHKIQLVNDAVQFKRSSYRVGPDEKKFIEAELSKLLKLGIIVPSRSPWGAPVVLVRKKSGEFRM